MKSTRRIASRGIELRAKSALARSRLSSAQAAKHAAWRKWQKYGLAQASFKILRKLSSPKKVQDFLDTLPINLEEGGDTYMSVERTLQLGVAHCLEGALVAALAFWIHGKPPLIMDLKSSNGDDHIVALFRQGGRWGAISKTNHTTLRFRDPVYETVRELALSYFHEYIHLKTGEKILISYSEPIDLRGFSGKKISRNLIRNLSRAESIASVTDWISGREELDWLAEAIDVAPHIKIYPGKNKKHLRRADKMELRAGNVVEWKGGKNRTHAVKPDDK